MSPAPRLAVESTKGRLPVPPAELSCRTRLEMRLTRMLGLPTFSNAFLQSSAFKFCLSQLNKARQPNLAPRANATEKARKCGPNRLPAARRAQRLQWQERKSANEGSQGSRLLRFYRLVIPRPGWLCSPLHRFVSVEHPLVLRAFGTTRIPAWPAPSLRSVCQP